jgi:PAS domain-containing protein
LQQLRLGLGVFDSQDRLTFCNQRDLNIWGLPASIALPATTFADVMAQTPGVETERNRKQAKPRPGGAGMRRRESKDDGRGRFHQHEQGVRNAMHDFGTGYSSPSLLRRVPFDHIKIKRCFVRDLGVHKDALPIIRALVGLGNSLGMQTALEGV